MAAGAGTPTLEPRMFMAFQLKEGQLQGLLTMMNIMGSQSFITMPVELDTTLNQTLACSLGLMGPKVLLLLMLSLILMLMLILDL